MALREEFERTGNWLFRWRSYLPLLVMAILLSVMPFYEYPGQSERLDHFYEIVYILISFFGLGIRIFTIGYAPERTSGRNTKKHVADTLNTTGAYSIVRNPLYLGNFFMGLGIALFPLLWYLVFIYILIFWIYYERIIFAEEAYLRLKFGDNYLNWADSTPVIFPNLCKYRKSELPFSWKNILKREYNGFFAIIVVMFILESISEYFVEGKYNFDPGWLMSLCLSFIVWISLRTIKKYTTVLDVESR